MGLAQNYLAIDLGAESGRAMLGRFDGERLQLSELHRFPNRPVRTPDGLHWDVLSLWSGIKQGIRTALQPGEDRLFSLGLDTWGIDFGLLDRDGGLIGNPFHYRDERTDGMMDAAFQRISREEIYQRTGIQFIQINSLYQLLSLQISQSPALEMADTFLTMPDLFNYWLTGRKVCEFTNATTTQCYDPRMGDWARSMLDHLGIPSHIFPEIVPPGTILGELQPSVTGDTGARGLTVVAPACHDTGSAVAAVPSTSGDVAWISSGTWSIMGVSVQEPVIDEQTLASNLTNEGGVERTFRLSKNIMGLWLVQECRRTWSAQGKAYPYDELTRLAAAAAALQAIVDPDDGRFLQPGDMPTRIKEYCRDTRQPVPQEEGAVIRCALESVALKYRWVLEQLESVLSRRLETIHIIGGGTQNWLLNQWTANATGRPVVAGPIEATAVGNILMQMAAFSHIASLEEGREIVRRSFQVEQYEPAHEEAWDEAYGRLIFLMNASA